MAYDPANPYRPLFATPSLPDQKIDSLAAKYEQKKAKVTQDPVTPQVHPLLAADPVDQTDLLDLGEASLYRAGGNLADLGKDISNVAFGTDFDSSLAAGWSNPETADIMAGVTPEYRQQLQEEQGQVLTDVAEGRYLDAVGSAFNVAGRTAMDSFATIPEIAAGALLTKAGGAGAPLLARKAKQLFSTGEKIAEAFDKAKTAKATADGLKKATKIGKAVKKIKEIPGMAAKAAGQASILTADLTQQQIQQYRENFGEDPSAERVAVMGLTTLATSIWQPAIMTKLFIPSFKKQIITDGRRMLNVLGDKTAIRKIADQVGSAANRIFQAGAAEGAQEYLETWREILTTDISPEEANNLSEAISKRISNKAHRDQALTGALLGMSAGTAIKGTIEAPGVAAATTVATTTGTAKTTAKGLKTAFNAMQNAARKQVLSDEELEVLRNDYETRKVMVEEQVAEIDETIKTVDKAKTVDDLLAVPGTETVIAKAQKEMNLTDDDLANPKNMKRLKDFVLRKQKADQFTLKAELEASNLAKITTQTAKGTAAAAKKAAEAAVEAVPEAVVEKTIQAAYTTKAAAKTALKAVKEIKSSAALGVVELGLKGGKENSKRAYQAAANLTVRDLERVITAVEKKNPRLGQDLTRIYKEKKDALKDLGQRTDDIINKDTLSPVIKNINDTGSLEGQSLAAVANAIRKSLSGKVDDKESAAAIRKAIDLYKKSEAYTNPETKGRINEKNMEIFEDRLANAEKRLDKDYVKEAKEFAEDVVDTVKDQAPKVKKAAKAAKEKIEDTDTYKKIAGLIKKLGDIKPKDRETKTVEEGPVQDTFRVMEQIARGGDYMVAVAHIPSLITQLKKKGYTTLDDFNDLLDQFPGLKANKEFLAALKSQYETNVLMDEVTDKMETETVPDNQVFEFFKDILPGCQK